MNNIRLLNYYKKYNSLRNITPLTNLNTLNFKEHNGFNIQKRNFSIKESVESIAKTQTGFFKTLSESTPVEYVQNFLLTIHDTTGLPWWSTIICTTILFRTSVTLPLAIYQNFILAKVQNISAEMPEIAKELKKEVSIAVRKYNWDEKTAKYHYKRSIKKQWNQLIIRENCHPLKGTILLWFQIPMWICLSTSLRNLVYMLPKNDFDAQLTFVELTVGGFGWIPNLTEIDSSYILPLTFGIINLAIIEIQNLSKTNTPTKFQRYLTNFFRGFSIFMIPIAANVPSCLVLYWTTSSAYGLIQNLILMSPKVKRFCRIPQTTKELENPYENVVKNFKLKLNNLPGLK